MRHLGPLTPTLTRSTRDDRTNSQLRRLKIERDDNPTAPRLLERPRMSHAAQRPKDHDIPTGNHLGAGIYITKNDH